MDDEYLPSRVPTALNLLQSFENDPALAGTHPRLSALRISKIAPTAPLAKEVVRPIRTGQRRLFRALPALIWRIRYSKRHAALSDASLIASLDLEVANVTGCSIKIESIELTLKGGDVRAIVDPQSQQLVHRPGDQISYLYGLQPQMTADGTPLYGTDGHILHLRMAAKAMVSDAITATLSIEWNTAVDFTEQHNAALVKAAHRLSNPTGQLPPKAPGPDSLPPQEDSQQGDELHKSPINVTLTISGPSRVEVGETFHWDAFIVNRSDKTRKLAILVLPRRKREMESHRPQRPSTSSGGGNRRDSKELLAAAVVDENIVYAKQKSARTDVADLICLTTDVRIG